MPEFRHESTSPEQIHLLGHHEHTPAHSHPEGHLVYPASGVLSMVTEAGSWIAPSTRVVWIPEGFVHQHRAHGETDMRIVFMNAICAESLPDHPAVLAATPLISEILKTLTWPGPRSPAAGDRLRGVLLDELAAAPEQPLHLPEPRDERLLAVTHLVEQDLTSPATLKELGRRVGASERTLSRLFRTETGMSFRQWRTQLRIHRSLILLTGGTSVLGTATACGWSNPSTFIEAFTALVGVSPGTYRRSLTD